MKWFTAKRHAEPDAGRPVAKICQSETALFVHVDTHPGKKLLFMGGEFGQWNEWNHDDGPQWELLDFENHRGVQQLVADLNKLVVQNPALHELDFAEEGLSG